MQVLAVHYQGEEQVRLEMPDSLECIEFGYQQNFDDGTVIVINKINLMNSFESLGAPK